jgi:AraC-like DNA-binding protein
MRVSSYAPRAALARYVSVFRVVESEHEITRILIPDGEITLGIRFGGAASLEGSGSLTRLPDASLAAVRSTARRMRTHAGGRVLLAAFRPGGAAQFFPQPLHEIHESTLDLMAFFPASVVERVSTRIAEARTHGERVLVLEQLLVEHMREETVDRVVASAVETIRAERGSVRIDALARRLDVRLDALEKRFRAVVGASPKQLASILRMKHALASHRPGTSLTRLALESGFADQSHFIREVRRVVGDSPRRFLSQGTHC